jgi:hypothetical protein
MDNDATSRALRAARERLFQFDPLLSMELRPQPVATGRNGFGSIWRFLPLTDLPLIATDCNHGAP